MFYRCFFLVNSLATEENTNLYIRICKIRELSIYTRRMCEINVVFFSDYKRVQKECWILRSVEIDGHVIKEGGS